MVRAKLWRKREWGTRRPVPPRLPDAADAGAGPERERPAEPQEGQAGVPRTFRVRCEPVRSILGQNLRGSLQSFASKSRTCGRKSECEKDESLLVFKNNFNRLK